MLALDPPVEHILVETTGIADPMPVVATLTRAQMRARVRVDGVITLVDAGAGLDDVIETVAGQAQLAAADVIVVNKVDLASPASLQELEDNLIVRKGSARLLRARQADLPLALLTSIGRFDPLAPDAHAHGHACDPAGCTHELAASDHLSADGFRSVSIVVPDALDETRFQRFLWNQIPAEVYRGKGLVRLGRQGRTYVFHRVGARTTFDAWDRPVDHPRAVFIGKLTDADEAMLRDSLLRCTI